MQSVEVEIFGRRFRLRSDDPQRTRTIAEEINRQIIEISQNYEGLDFTKLLLLICLQQQEQVLILNEKNTGLSSDLERLNQMISMIIPEV
jgi:cell division protein ZapA (FtsZ GTPase activity inhibitor)